MNTTKVIMLSMVVAFMASGCSTIIIRGDKWGKPHAVLAPCPVYLATQGDGRIIGESVKEGGFGNYVLTFFGILDVPFSIVSDTLLLPLDLIRMYTLRNERAIFDEVLETVKKNEE